MFLFSKSYLKGKVCKLILLFLSSFLVIVGIFILMILFPPEKYKESSDLLNIESYIQAQDIYFDFFNSYGPSGKIGFSFEGYGRVIDSISLEQAKEIGLELNQPILVNKQFYRVIIEITDCRYSAKRFWLVEKGKVPLKLKGIQYKCGANQGS